MGVDVLERQLGSHKTLCRLMLLHPGPHLRWEYPKHLLQDDGLCNFLLGVLLWPNPAPVETFKAMVGLDGALFRRYHHGPELQQIRLWGDIEFCQQRFSQVSIAVDSLLVHCSIGLQCLP